MRYEDYKIEGINENGITEQRAHCPQCETRMPYKHSHSRNSKDLAVNIEKKTWMCWRCGWTGSLHEKKIENYFTQIKKKSKELEKKEGMLNYFQQRKIAPGVVNRNLITADEVYFPQHKKTFKCIAFNYYIGEDLINVKWRNSNKEFLQVTNAPQIFYKLNDIQDSNIAIVTEGEIDALSFETAGFKYSVSVPAGGIQPNAKNFEKKLEFIDNCWEYIKHIETWYLCFDTDLPGRKLKEEFSRRVGRFKCKIIKLPDDCKDANEVINTYGIEKLRECFQNAEPYPIEGIHEAKSVFDKLDDIYEYGFPDGFKTGNWYSLDQKMSFYTSTLYGINGIPAHGKSNWMDHLMINLSITNGIRWGVFSSENSKIEIHIRRLVEIVIGKGMLPGSQIKMEKSELDSAKEFIQEHIYFIVPPNNENKLNSILEAGEHLVRTKGIKGLVIDPWNTIDHEIGKMSETDYIQKTLNQLTYYERNLDLMLFIVFHPSKMPKQNNGKKYQVPGLYDGNGSAHWGNKLEVVLTIYRDYAEDLSYTKATLAYIQKVKHDFMGQTGFVTFQFDTSCRRFKDEGTINFGNINQNYLYKYNNEKKENNNTLKEKYETDYPPEWDEF